MEVDHELAVATLKDDYARILKDIDARVFDLKRDKYSGVFLPVPFKEYWQATPRVMLVGRETAGWNTANGKNTMGRVLGLIKDVDLKVVVEEAVLRYGKHLDSGPMGSKFKQYYFRLAKEIGVDPRAMVYANLFAWDYNSKTPRDRPENEFEEVASISGRLLASQIKYLKPDIVVFAAGVKGIDRHIKRLFNEYFNGYVTSAPLISGKLWEFKAANATCYRVAHPRATHGHGIYRDMVIGRIKEKLVAESIGQ